MAGNDLTILRSYAKAAPESLPLSIRFQYSEKTTTVFDRYNKSIFHFLILPRILPGAELDPAALENLRSLLKADKNKAKRVIDSLAEEANKVKEKIEEEMIKVYGFKWDIWTGFHAQPSMAHLHLHVLSADLVSEKLKHKKHYNSFRPDLGFFIHLDDVLSWFEATHSYFEDVVKQFKPSEYEAKLKEDLVCFRCYSEMKNIPTLKAHLQEEWNKLERTARASAKRKHEIEKRQASKSASQSQESKATKTPAPDVSERDTKRAKLQEETTEST
ncbi:hypothetical protein BDN70DRAFT_877992 [Pholiota conissans]|uniref:Aprataxin C2HE/C2H2/C2HC zinc finger domain-containing protein n=1 Tax=Pholiota conissans TaxID=109636 RepID=A0A9P5Z2U4_9AGAR|nr:hypothetical protein BDN70DRAFT_877992 [Pholiota conissans]